MKYKPLRIGILGTADIAKRSILPAISKSPKYTLVGIASRTISNSMDLSKNYGCQALAPYSKIVDKRLVDVLYIPLPNSLHFEWVKHALSNGIHVLVEKSMACNPTEVNLLNELARTRRLSLVENFQFRFHRQLKVIKEILSSGIIGSINHIRSAFEIPPFNEPSNIRYQKDLGGGALLDTGAYPIKIAQIFLGDKINIKSATLKYHPVYDVDITGGVFVQQQNGPIFGSLTFGFNNHYQCSLEIYGTKGSIKTDRIFTAPPNIKPNIIIDINGSPRKILSIEPDNHFINMLDHFYNTVHDDSLKEIEYKQNIIQSNLINNIKLTAEDEH